MFLKAIELQGFKSFAERTVLRFDEPVAAIVGPNGSGKSNILDAMLWALGEQSAKTLRGQKMEDVIFTGTKDRKPLGFAHVSLTFDNATKWLPLEYDEVKISRRMYRSGESEFQINGKSCRLKDIKELFLDTGIGRDGYSMIGQGKIESILSSKPDQRRSIFEEAAGIARFRQRKEETLRKLKTTEENVQRIEDILGEILRQERSLAREVKRMEKFEVTQREAKSLDEALCLHQIRGIEEKLSNLKKIIAQRRESLAAQRTSYEKLEEEVLGEEEALHHLEEELHGLRQEVDRAQMQLSQERAELAILEERGRHRERTEEELTLREEELKKRRGDLLDEQKEVEKERGEAEERSLEQGLKVSRLEDEVKAIESEFEKIKSHHSQELISTRELQESLEAIERRLHVGEALDRERTHRRDQLEEVLAQLEQQQQESEANHKTLRTERQALEEKISSRQKTLVSLSQEIQALEAALQKMGEELQALEVEVRSAERQKTFAAGHLEQLDGFHKSVRSFLQLTRREHLFQGQIRGVVADLFSMEKQVEIAMSVGLGGSVQNVVIEEERDAKAMIRLLKERRLGRLTFLPISTYTRKYAHRSHPTPPAESMGYLSSYIETENSLLPIFEGLLGDTLLAKDYDTAQALARKSKVRRIITLEGDIFQSNGSISGGSLYQGQRELLNRRARYEEECLRLEELKSKSQEAREKREDLLGKKNGLLEEFGKNREEKESLEENLKRLEFREVAIKESLEKGKDHISRYQEEFLRLDEESKRNHPEGEKDQDRVQALREELGTHQDALHEWEKRMGEKEEELSKTRRMLSEEKILLATVKERLSSLDARLSFGREEVSRIDCELENLHDRRTILNEEYLVEGEERTEKEEKIRGLKLQYTGLLETYQKREQELKKQGILCEEKRRSLHDLEKACTTHELADKDLAYDAERLSTEQSRITDTYFERYGEDLEGEGEILSEEEVEKKKTRLEKLRRELTQMGGINPEVREEYQEVAQRLQVYQGQMKDLQEGRDSLGEILKNLDEEMRKLFRAAFREISENFDRIFQILFRGGRATISLEGADILEAGVEIICQPPGKKLQSLSLLSGGERALTAVALLFALLEHRPAPFCILDEIDAALDDANISRYADFLRSLDEMQFILITHRKPTMRIADILYGVTMEDMGVSKIIPLSMEDYKEEPVNV